MEEKVKVETKAAGLQKKPGASSSASGDEVARLESEIGRLRDERSEERFIFFLVIVVLLDVIIFASMSNWGGPIAILVLELVGLVVFAKKRGLESVVEFFHKFLDGRKK